MRTFGGRPLCHYVLFGIVDRDGRLEFINAGHPSPLLVRAGEVVEAFTEGGCPVGLLPEASYFSSCVALRPRDTLVLYSDGVTEAVDPDDEMFGVSRLRELLLGQYEAPLEALQKTILESVARVFAWCQSSRRHHPGSRALSRRHESRDAHRLTFQELS